MEKKCSRCGKSFNPDDKSIKVVDANGNSLRIDLCSMCELKHISRKEAEKYVIDKIHEMMDEAIRNIEPELFNSVNASEYFYKDYWKAPFTIGRFDNLVKVVKDNEICTN